LATCKTSKDGKEKKTIDIRQRISILRSDQRCDIKECAVYSSRKVKGVIRESLFFCNTCKRHMGMELFQTSLEMLGGIAKAANSSVLKSMVPYNTADITDSP
jgi:hypothetical protein